MKSLLLFMLMGIGCVIPGRADVRMPKIFSNNMVLQQQKPIVVWGWDTPGTNVTVTLGDKSAQSTVNAKGEWKVTLPAMTADGKPYAMTVKGSTSVALDNVVLGEVWLASGQSNMEFRLSWVGGKAADEPDLRLFLVGRKTEQMPLADVDPTSDWKVCSPANAGGFSATAYYFGHDLQVALKVPVGIIESAISGSPIETWTPPEGFAMAKDAFEKTKSGKAWPPPLLAYNGMIHPLIPFSIRGAIWYQGEANQTNGALYADKMKALIGSWRKLWGDDFAFYFVQIGPLPHPTEASDTLPIFWEAQVKAAAEMPPSGTIVINDIATTTKDGVATLQLHPPNKKEVGLRLSLLALANTYGQKDLVYSGPTFKSLAVEGDKLRVTFDNIGGGLMARDGEPLNSFEIVDADQGGWVAATAVVDGANIVLFAPGVSKPVAMRFAWTNTSTPNLMNKEGLPAGSFRAGTLPERIPAQEPTPPQPPPAPAIPPTPQATSAQSPPPAQ